MTYTVAAIYDDGEKTVAKFDNKQEATIRYEAYLYSVTMVGDASGLFMVTLCEGCTVVRGTMFN